MLFCVSTDRIMTSQLDWVKATRNNAQAITTEQCFSQKGVQPSYGWPFLEEIIKRKIHLISYNFMGKHAFWKASFLCLAKSLYRII